MLSIDSLFVLFVFVLCGPPSKYPCVLLIFSSPLLFLIPAGAFSSPLYRTFLLVCELPSRSFLSHSSSVVRARYELFAQKSQQHRPPIDFIITRDASSLQHHQDDDEHQQQQQQQSVAAASVAAKVMATAIGHCCNMYALWLLR